MRKMTNKRNRKHHDGKGSQRAADQSWLSRLWSPPVWIPVSLLVAVVLFLILFKVEGQPFQWKVDAREWTGFGQSYDNDVSEVAEKGTETTGKTTKKIDKTTTTAKRLQPAKTLWDWMTLLLAPATLAGLGFLFQFSQEKAKRDKERADVERSADQQREQALQSYLDQLSALLVDKQLKKLLAARLAAKAAKLAAKYGNLFTNASVEEDADESVTAETGTEKPEISIDVQAALDVVKARTLALLRMFEDDISRKASVLSFLADTNLLNQLNLDLSGINLKSANLKKVNFSTCNLFNANLSRATLSDANLTGANLTGASLISANLSRATLGNANLMADLSNAVLFNAYLSAANLISANLSGADLTGANLSNAKLFNAKLSNADLSIADLSGADLFNANLSGADLTGANFSNANLIGANLIGANLSNADLIKAAVTRIQSAKNWQKAHYDPEMRELLGLPPETSKAAQD